MKLKIKLPLLFLVMFVMVLASGVFYLNSMIPDKKLLWSGAVQSSVHTQMLVFFLIAVGLAFTILIAYFHFSITKPLQALNRMLKKVNIRRLHVFANTRRRDEIGDLYRHFCEMEERLYQARVEQNHMVASITHDLKTPLTAINGFIELLAGRSDLSEKEIHEYYELIHKKAKHIAELLNGLSSFVKDELDLEKIDMKPVDASKFFESIAGEYETELSGFDYKLDWKHSFSSNQHILVNEHMIRRVFGNLVSNAVRYGGKKDLIVYLSGFVRDCQACFQVEDNGDGVPADDLPSLLHKFFTVDKSRRSENGSMGLGLASCRSIIEQHGGEINAFHSNHGGLGILFILPLAD